MAQFETVIGMEIHVELATQSKVFCGCSTKFGAPPNTNVCPVCLGFPGSLPVLNRSVVEFSLRAALAFHCSLTSPCLFERKNYFYPDLPKAYQISQRMLPLGTNGWVEIETTVGTKRVGISDAHMEEDTGKSLHGGEAGSDAHSLIDFNRAGVPLLEIVSAPDLRSIEEAEAYMETMRSILLYLGISECRMEHGHLRFEASVSLRPFGATEFGTRVEVKNLNSFRAVTGALKAEITRQEKILNSGGTVAQQTMLWDEARGVTAPMRSKEHAHDYRYFPEPDLVPVVIDKAWRSRVERELPELPRARRARFVTQYELPDYDARILTATKASADFFEACVADYGKPKVVSNWMMGELARLLNEAQQELPDTALTPAHVVGMLRLMDDGTISGAVAKRVLEEMFATGAQPADIVEARGLKQVSDDSALAPIIAQVVADHPQVIADLRAGKDRSKQFLVGQVMKATRGRANPGRVNELLDAELAKP